MRNVRMAEGPNLRSSARLLSAFRYEQSDPDRFYRLLAEDTASLIASFAGAGGLLGVEVGSGPGDIAEALRGKGARMVLIDPDWDEMHCRQRSLQSAVQADGRRLPVADSVFDFSCSSNVLEHVPDPISIVGEMARVTVPGGTVFVNFTTWLSPFGGHETSPWHYLGGHYAMKRYTRAHGVPPKNRYGENLFPVRVSRFLRELRTVSEIDVVAALPRYFPSWMRWVVRTPVLAELLAWNLTVVARKKCPRS